MGQWQRFRRVLKSELHSLILKNAAIMIIGETAARIISALIAIFLARYLGTTNYGELQFAFAFSALFQFALDMGFNGLLIREVARDRSRARKYAENIIPLKVVLAVICYCVLAGIVFFIHKSYDLKLLVLVAGVHIIFVSLIDVLYSIFQAFERMYLRALLRILNSVLLLLLCGFVVIRKGTVMEVLLGYFVSTLIIFCLALILVRRKVVWFSVEFDFPFWKRLLRTMIPFAMIAILASIYSRIDIVMLSFLKGEDAVGVYAAAFNVFASLHLLPLLIINAAYPTLARFYSENRKRLHSLFIQYFAFVAAIGCLLGGALVVFSPFVMPRLFGPSFADSARVLQILGVNLPISATLNFMGCYFIILGRQKTYAKVFFMALLLNILLNYAFIIKFSYIGAAIATIISQTYQLCLLCAIYYYTCSEVAAS